MEAAQRRETEGGKGRLEGGESGREEVGLRRSRGREEGQ
jgi:hypothetical protein